MVTREYLTKKGKTEGLRYDPWAKGGSTYLVEQYQDESEEFEPVHFLH